MAGGRRVRESCEHLPGEVLQPHHSGIERFVGVEVDAHSRISSDLQEHVGGGLDRSGSFEMGTAADEVGPGREGLAQQRTMRRAGPADHGLAGQGDDLDVDASATRRWDLDQRLDVAGQPVERSRRRAWARTGRGSFAAQQPDGPLGAPTMPSTVTDGSPGDHRRDRAEEVTRSVGEQLGEDGLVESGHVARRPVEQHAPGQVEPRHRGGVDEEAGGLAEVSPSTDPDVDDGPVGRRAP